MSTPSTVSPTGAASPMPSLGTTDNGESSEHHNSPNPPPTTTSPATSASPSKSPFPSTSSSSSPSTPPSLSSNQSQEHHSSSSNINTSGSTPGINTSSSYSLDPNGILKRSPLKRERSAEDVSASTESLPKIRKHEHS